MLKMKPGNNRLPIQIQIFTFRRLRFQTTPGQQQPTLNTKDLQQL